jgi:predicted ArsR family transcriptional regulator
LGKVNQSVVTLAAMTSPEPTGPPRRRPATEAEAKALASAVRIRILRLCLDRALTNREIARRLDANPATVLHHVRTLVDTGFLVAEPVRRGARGSREVPYRATRKSWRVDTHGSGITGQSAAIIGAFLDEVRAVDNLDEAKLARLGLRLTEAEFTELNDRLAGILQEYADRPPSADGRPYSVFVALYEDVTRD